MEIQPVDHLVAAVLSGDRGRAEVLIGRDPHLGHSRNMFGVSPIHAAHFTGRPRLVAMLRHPDHVDDFYLSAELGELEAVEAGADTGAAAASGPHRGETPAASALSQGHLVLASDLDPECRDA